jgi:probable rRNA maturation factor
VIVNLQRIIKVDTSLLARFLSDALGQIAEIQGRCPSIAFVSDRRMKELNSFFRGKDSATDVLSFPHEPDEFVQSARFGSSDNEEMRDEARTQNEDFLGDIVISAEQAARQAHENGLSLENEIKQLILHGLLHLCGHDHETDNGEMNARELELRDKLGI